MKRRFMAFVEPTLTFKYAVLVVFNQLVVGIQLAKIWLVKLPMGSPQFFLAVKRLLSFGSLSHKARVLLSSIAW